MRLTVEGLAHDLFRRGNGDVGEFATKVGDGAVAFKLNLSSRPFERPFTIAVGLFTSLRRDAASDLLGVANDLLAFPASDIELGLNIGLRLRRFGAGDFSRVQAFADLLLAIIQHPEDRLIERQPQNDEKNREVDDLRDQLGKIDA